MRTKVQWNLMPRYLAFTSCAGVILLLYARLFFGVDLTDEAFYNSLPLSFAQGRRPYLDELIVVQSFAILLAPLTNLYVLATGGEAGLVLFMRHCFFLLSLFTAYVGFRFQRRYMPVVPSIFGSLLIVSFWPFSIPSLSYNTLGMSFLASGTLILVSQLSNPKSSFHLPAGISFLFLAAFSYPSFAISAAILGLVSGWYLFKAERIDKWARISFSLGLVFTCMTAYLIFFYAGLERLGVIFNFVKTYGVHGTFASKLSLITHQFLHDIKFVVLQGAFLSLPPLFYRFAPKIVTVCSLLLAIVLLKTSTAGFQVPPFHITFFVISIVCFLLACVRRELILPSVLVFLSGALSAWTSSNGLTNFAIGSLACVVLYSVLLFRIFNADNRPFSRVGYYILVCALLIFQVRSLSQSVYGDDSNLQHLSETVKFGPYLGLRTTPEKVMFINELYTDIEHASKGRQTVAFFDFFAAGPLFTDLSLHMPIMWSASLSQFPQDRDVLAKFYESHGNLPDILVWFHSIPVSKSYKYELNHKKFDSLNAKLIPHYNIRVVRPDYTIYEENK